MSLRAALIYDSVMTFAMAIEQLGEVNTMSIQCDDPDSVWDKGLTILNYMKNVRNEAKIRQIFEMKLTVSFRFKVKSNGITGKIDFDNVGLRSNISVDVLEITEFGLEKIGTWMSGIDDSVERLKINRQPTMSSRMPVDDNTLRNKSLIIITALVTIPFC